MLMLKWIVDVYAFLVLARIALGFIALPAADGLREGLSPITDPYLLAFRRWMPPVGVLDLSPVAAWLVLQIASESLTLAMRYGRPEGMYR